jgi:uncharacterized protein (DUF1330 family)
METQHDGPITIVGMLWFQPDGGEARYREYLEAAKPTMEKHLGRPFTSQGFKPIATLAGDLDPDFVAINEFPSEAVFMAAVQDPDYPSHLVEGFVARIEVVEVRPD